jgi:hypothetical protein
MITSTMLPLRKYLISGPFEATDIGIYLRPIIIRSIYNGLYLCPYLRKNLKY